MARICSRTHSLQGPVHTHGNLKVTLRLFTCCMDNQYRQTSGFLRYYSTVICILVKGTDNLNYLDANYLEFSCCIWTNCNPPNKGTHTQSPHGNKHATHYQRSMTVGRHIHGGYCFDQSITIADPFLLPFRRVS